MIEIGLDAKDWLKVATWIFASKCYAAMVIERAIDIITLAKFWCRCRLPRDR